jgi:hypothetical protein
MKPFTFVNVAILAVLELVHLRRLIGGWWAPRALGTLLR